MAFYRIKETTPRLVTKHRVTEEKPSYRPLGRFVCDYDLTECHLFDTVVAARKFAKDLGRDCNIGWLAPVYDRRTGRNRKASVSEARSQIAETIAIIDHRRPAKGGD